MRHGTVRLRLAGIAAAAMASAVLASPASALPTFAAQTAVLVHAGPGDVAVGDFDGDGHQDMAVANGDQATVSIRLGTGTGSFTGSTSAATDFSTGNGGPLAVVTGDFNSDGKLDLATANSGTNDISVLMGNGDGTFVTPATHFSTGSNSNPNSLAIGDFNEDGKLDLAVSLSDPGHVAVLLGTTPGSFGAPTTFTVSQAPTGVRVADFNGDGHDDIAVAGGSSTGFVSVLLGTGSGSFAAPANLSVGANVRGIVVGDFNGDGSEDIAVTVASTATVAVFLATGGGSFGSPSSYAVAVNPSKITTADFDRDGHLDLAVSNQGSHNVSVLQGSAAGTFAGAAILNVLDGPLGLTTADFDGDGRQDIAVADSSASIASVLLNTTAVPTLTQLGSPNGSIGVSGFEPTDVAVAPDVTGSPSNVYLSSPQGIVVFDRDRATGVLTRAGCLNAAGTDGCTLLPGLGSSTDGQLAVSPDGKSVYMATGTALLTLTRNPSTGALTPAGCVNQDGSGGCSTSRQGSSFDPDWVRVSPENTSAYAGPPANTAGGVMSVFTRNTT
ncbi:MAG: hypothetical protein QOK30_1024, partial [Nocardioidaceae bacterium]|nr:hypothetical protein [Nocardioidaceae bacterium]